MIRAFVFPIIATIAIYIADSFSSEKFSPFKYAFLFFIFLITAFIFSDASDYYDAELPEAKTEFQINLFKEEFPEYFLDEMLTDKQIQMVKKKIQFHKEKGMEHFKKASNIIPIIPGVDQKRLREYFANAIEASTWPGSMWSRITAALIATLINYGLDVYDAFEQMKNHLSEAKHHFELMEFHENLLKGESV